MNFFYCGLLFLVYLVLLLFIYLFMEKFRLPTEGQNTILDSLGEYNLHWTLFSRKRHGNQQ